MAIGWGGVPGGVGMGSVVTLGGGWGGARGRGGGRLDVSGGFFWQSAFFFLISPAIYSFIIHRRNRPDIMHSALYAAVDFSQSASLFSGNRFFNHPVHICAHNAPYFSCMNHEKFPKKVACSFADSRVLPAGKKNNIAPQKWQAKPCLFISGALKSELVHINRKISGPDSAVFCWKQVAE